MPRAVSRRSRRGSIIRHAPFARAAGNMLAKGYKKWKGSSKSKGASKKGVDDSTPLYGATFTSKVAYRKRRPNKKRARFAKRSFRTHISNSLKLQNAQNALSSNKFTVLSALDNQSWWSLDLCNAYAIEWMIRTQLPAAAGLTSLRDFHLMLKTFSLKYYLTNTGGIPVTLDIYHVRPRRNILYAELDNPTTPTNGRVLSTNFVNNTTAVANDQLQDTSGDTIPGANAAGYNPFMYSNFCKNWMIVKMRTVVVPVGGTFEERDTVANRSLNIAKMGIFNSAEFAAVFPTASTRMNFYIRGLSRSILVRQRGMPDAVNNIPVSQVSVSWEETSCCKVIQTKPGSSATLPTSS